MLRPEVAFARKLRREMTLPEVMLWQQLRRKGLGLKFRKQHPNGPYTADFYCAETRLVVEVDGEAHNRAGQPKHDAVRNAFMVQNGYSVLRIAATDVLRDMDAVTTAIRTYAARPPPPSFGWSPSPCRGGMRDVLRRDCRSTHDGAVLRDGRWRGLAAMIPESRPARVMPYRSGIRYGKWGCSVSPSLSTLEVRVRPADSTGS